MEHACSTRFRNEVARASGFRRASCFGERKSEHARIADKNHVSTFSASQSAQRDRLERVEFHTERGHDRGVKTRILESLVQLHAASARRSPRLVKPFSSIR